jgi:(p)ppGpp synthase/HD superfamily hydrolase
MGMARGSMPNSVRGLAKTQAAFEYARELHAAQYREADGAPFIDHPREVASLPYDVGARDDLIAPAVLRDVIEKTSARAPDLRKRFAPRSPRSCSQ